MYCPKCFDNSLSIADKGIVHIAIDGIQKDNGRFLYTSNESVDEMVADFKVALREVFKWYVQFKNRPAKSEIQLFTNSFVCFNGCVLPADTSISIVGVLFEREVIAEVLRDLSDEYKMRVVLKDK